MAEDSTNEYLWSDRQNEFRLASVGLRLFAGFLDWIFTVGIAAILAAILATVINALVSESFVITYYSVLIIVGTVVHIAPAIMVVRRGEKPGYMALRLLVKRDGAGGIGWRRAVARGVLGSPALTVPWLAIGAQILVVFCVETSSTWFGTSDSLAESIGGYGFEFSSVNLAATGIAIPALVLLNHAWMVFDAKKRGLHDVIVGTVVVGGRIVRRDPDAMTTLAADRTRGDLDYPAAHRVF